MKLPVRWNMKDGICDAYKICNQGTSPIHGHHHFLITLITRGSGIQLLNGREIPFGEGDLFTLSPQDFHQNLLPKDESYDYFGVKLGFDSIDSLPSDVCDMKSFPLHVKLSYESYVRILRVFEALTEECRRTREQIASEYMKRALLSELLVLVFREHNQHSNSECIPFVNRILGYLYSSFREKVSVADAAAFVGYTPNYFNAIFRDTFGKPFMKYLSGIRLDYAKNLLASTDAPLTEIALESGFSSLAHFSRLFKKEYKVSASEWRKDIRDFNSLE